MIAFDYIHSARPALIRRVLEVRIASALKAPLFAIVAATAIVGMAWLIENQRLSGVLAMETDYRARYDESRIGLMRTTAIYASLERILRLAAEVRSIRQSGDVRAIQLEEIGNRLPAHVWLTSITTDESGITLSGKAVDLATLGRTMLAVSTPKHPYDATLVSASRDDRTSVPATLEYQLHLRQASK